MSRTASITTALVLTASLCACSFPGYPGAVLATPAPVTLTAPPVTEVSTVVPAAPSPTAPATVQPLPSAAPTTLPSQTPVPPSPTPVCDRAAPGNPIDITIPDDTDMLPGQGFTKTWRLLNSGACTWTQDYSVVWFSGETFSAPLQMKFAKAILPGHGVDIAVDMVAPQKTGSYQSTWKLQDSRGVLFGIGPNGDAPFWVRIHVVEPEPPTPTAPPAAAPTVAVFAGGLANLQPGSGLDADTNQIGTGQGDDLMYQSTGDSSHQLAAQNGARIVVFGSNAPKVEECQAASLGTDPVTLDGIQAGTYFCYRTNQGLPGWMRLVFLNPQDGVLSVETLTWSVP